MLAKGMDAVALLTAKTNVPPVAPPSDKLPINLTAGLLPKPERIVTPTGTPAALAVVGR